jgi:dipeptidyl aminopeptidase/acylaminoacyl peptidase
LALIVEDPKPNESRKDATPPPIVIDRFYFKEDGAGYLTQRRRHLYLYDLATRRAELLTPGNFDEVLPSWSPDGKQIAFASKRRDDPDRNDTFGIFIIEPRVGAVPRLLVEYQGAGGDTEWATRPQWSPNGQQIAFVAGGDPKLIYYATYGIAVVGSAGGTPRYLTKSLDRNAWAPQWSADGREIYFLLEESETQQLARVALDAGRITRITDAAHTVGEVSVSGGRIAILRSTSERPDEVFAVERKALRQLSRQNDAWLQDIELAPVVPIRARSADGTQVHGFMLRAKNQKAEPAPTILRIHGGPVAQYTHSFMFEWQLLAAEGFAVVAGNPRGSSGRGEAFASAIYADWGRKDTQDVLALVDAAVARGVADPVRLGVGGWSYGGILTNYVIAQDTRFKAAISGASISNAIAGYGTDMYVREYEIELGVPWKNLNTWLQISSPFLHADRIVTPTLFICGDQDFNVPLLNSEQMYQALRSRNVPTQLVIYPGQTHAITKLSYRRDRLQRYLDWYSRYLTK